jgi:tetratricopeptide (TPR) repeat protein
MKLESIEKYREILRKDPNSQAFAALADAYREMGMLEDAEKVARLGIGRHPSYVSGLVALGRVLVAKQLWTEAEQVLQKATTLAPENILGHQLLGQVYLQQKRPKEALKAYKLVLFLNPQSEKARRAVEKLESLTADEYEADVFEMKKLAPQESKTSTPLAEAKTSNPLVERSLERTLSLIDAYIVRNEISRAKKLLNQARQEFPGESELESRWDLLGENTPFEEATPLEPDLNREHFIRDRKLQRLNYVLQRIKQLER